MKVFTVLWYELLIFKKKFWTITSGAMISPVLYLIAFGWGLGDGITAGGMNYMDFVIPGIIAMSTMTVSFGAVGNDINISRIYYKTYEEFITAPVHMWEYSVGKIIAGALRGMYSAVLMILISLIFKSSISISPYFLMMAFLNALVFAALGFMIGMIINSHMEMNKFSSFIITPMSFLCGTFFPVDKMPGVLKTIVYYLPLTQATTAMRSAGTENMLMPPLILTGYLIIFIFFGIRLCSKAE